MDSRFEIHHDGPLTYLDNFCDDSDKEKKLITAKELNSLLRRQDPVGGDSAKVQIDHKRVAEQFELQRIEGKSVVFCNVEFEEKLDLTQTRGARSLEFYRCSFAKEIDATEVSVAENLVFYRCVFGTGETTANVHLDASKVGGDWILRRCLVTGAVFASGIRVHGDALLGGLRVKAPTEPFPEGFPDNLQNPDSEKIKERLAQYEQKIRESLVANTKAYEGGETYKARRVSLRLTDAKIDGKLELAALFPEPVKGDRLIQYRPNVATAYRPYVTLLAGDIEAESVNVGGWCDLRGLVVLGGLNFRNATLTGRVEASSFYVMVHDPGTNAHGSETGDSILVRLVVQGSLDFFGAHLHSYLYLGAAYIGGGLSLEDACAGSIYSRHQQPADLRCSEQAVRLHIGAMPGRVSLLLNGAQCKVIELAGLRLEGGIQAIAGIFGRLIIDDFPILVAEKTVLLVPPDVESVVLRSVVIRGDLSVSTIQIKGRGSTSRPEHTGSLLIQQCTIEGNLSIGADGAYSHGLQILRGRGEANVAPSDNHAAEDAKYQTRVQGQIDLSKSVIKGDVNLTHVCVDKRICLDDVEVTGDVRLSRYASNPSPRRNPIFETRCSRLEMDLMESDGDLDLTGLVVKKRTAEQSRTQSQHGPEDDPDVIARGVKVGGMILLNPTEEENRAERQGAYIEGKLLMPAASANRLVFSGRNFESSGQTPERAKDSSGTLSGKNDGARIDLERSTLRRLDVLHPLPDSIDLSNVTVDRWEIGPRHEGTIDGDGDGVDPHVALLGKTKPFKTGTYAQIERALRQEGDARLADEVYRAMRRRWTREKWKRLKGDGWAWIPWIECWWNKANDWVAKLRGIRWIKRRFNKAGGLVSLLLDIVLGRWMVGYGTTWVRLLVAVLLLAVPSLLIFSRQENVVASTGVIEAMAAPDPMPPIASVFEVHPRDAHHPWGWTEACIMTARYHVPIIGNALEPRFEPTRQPISLPSWLYVSWSPLPPPTGSFWATIMSGLNWVLWTLLLLVVARNVRVRMAAGTE